MIDERRPAAVGFHSGELAVQHHADVQAEAARLAPMVAPAELRAGMAAFIAQATFAALTARDGSRRLWTSALLGSTGFANAASPTTLQIDSAPPHADPLHLLPAGQPVGVIFIDFTRRRRVRINGILAEANDGVLTLEVEQAYGNCPQYIQRRHIHIDKPHAEQDRMALYSGETLRPDDIRLIENSDTFFLGTTHPTSGNDASHRGGPAGFVRVTPEHLWWPDYPGNNMFNSLGNLSVDPSAALLFVDFAAATTLQLSGTATVQWDAPAVGDDGHTGRRVRFSPRHVVASAAPALGESEHTAYPHNPPLTDR